MLILPAVLLFAAGSARGQDTVYIGGSGQTSVEIDLGALDRYQTLNRAGQGLRHPGTADGGLGPVTLRPPGGASATDSARVEAPEPEEMVTKLETPPATDIPAAKPVVPEPMPEPEPEPAAAAEEMPSEERAAAVAGNEDSVSSASLADEAARSAGDGAAQAVLSPEPEPEVEPETEMAALDPAAASVAPAAPGESMQIVFAVGEATLPKSAQASLAAVAATLGQDETLRLPLKAYAGGGDESASHARRLSLSRALAVRSELIEQGVRSTRIDVRALGNKSENGTSDRVDVILVQR